MTEKGMGSKITSYVLPAATGVVGIALCLTAEYAVKELIKKAVRPHLDSKKALFLKQVLG